MYARAANVSVGGAKYPVSGANPVPAAKADLISTFSLRADFYAFPLEDCWSDDVVMLNICAFILPLSTQQFFLS